MRVLLDTNIYVYRFVLADYVKPDKRDEWKELHSKSKIIVDSVLAGKHYLIIPSIVLVEIASRIAYLTDDEDLGESVVDKLKNLAKAGLAEIVYLDKSLTDESISFALRSGLKGVDAVIGRCCLTKQATLMTNDVPLWQAIISVPPDVVQYRIDAYLLRSVNEAQVRKLFDP